MFLRYHLLYHYFFVLNTGVGGVGGWAARVRARTRTRNIPSPSFARGSYAGRKLAEKVAGEATRTGYRFIPISRSSPLNPTSLPFLATSRMEKAA